jgi:hypothetical protein
MYIPDLFLFSARILSLSASALEYIFIGIRAASKQGLIKNEQPSSPTNECTFAIKNICSININKIIKANSRNIILSYILIRLF